jgi:hypothetical protein
MLCNKSMPLKLENIIVFPIVFISYFKSQCIVGVLCLCFCGLHQRAALRVSYSKQAVLSMMLSVFAESMILSGPVITAVVVAATNVKSIPTATVLSATTIAAAFSAAALS